MFCSVLRRFLSQLYLLLVIIYGMNVHAFSGRTLSTASSTMNRQMKTELMAWSLPNPSDFRSFPTMKSAWYDEYNPTARRTVYNDSGFSEDLKFSNLGADWPSFVEELDANEVPSEASPPRRNRNPFRRVAGLASRFRRRV